MSTAVRELLRDGGPVLLANLALAVVLYSRCCGLLLQLVRTRRTLAGIRGVGTEQLPTLRRWQAELQDSFRRQRLLIGAMIAAAPLLGLLGTVAGMITTFESLSGQAGSNSMEGLAGGISEALLNTEAGLAVAIPAVLLLYYAHRLTQKGVGRLVELEAQGLETF
ncbi:MAG: MotA/TolQ/ExbB proton channel family protein [Opitutaceae bacterium]|nr:MotA/TolQ/ExbB proton channel family protein [Opitutaceae bacterium]